MICTAAPGDWCSIVRTDCRDATTEGCAAPSPARDTAGAGEVGAGRRGAEVPYRVWAQAERGPGGDTRTRAHTVLTHGRQTRACPVTRTHLYTPSRPRRSDRQTRRDAAHRCLHSAAAPPPPSLETSLNIYVPQGQPRSAGEPQGGRQLEGRPVACAQGLRRRASGQSKPGPSGAPRRSPTVGCSRLGAGRPPFRACRRHSFICGPFSDSLPADAYLATSVSKYNSRYPPLPGVRSSAAGAAAGRALLGAVGRREEG